MWSDITLPPINLWNAPKGITLSRKDPFKTSLAANVFKQKYALHQSQSWYEKARDIVNDVCGVTAAFKYPLMSKEDREQLIQFIYELKFLPGGRYIYYAGRQARFYNNCASGETKLLTDKGWVRFDEVVGETVNVLSPIDGEYKPATMHYHGTQDVYEYTFAPLRGKSKIEFKVSFTEDHKWPLIGGGWTEELAIGDVVPANSFSLDKSDVGFAHGFVFGDGNSNGQLRLCCEKDIAYLDRLSRVANTVSYPSFANGDPCLYFKQGRGVWKELPTTNDPEYIASFIMGWLAADGSDNRILNSVNKDAMEYFRKYAPYAGLVLSGDLREQVRDTKIGDYEYKDHKIYIQHYSRGASWQGFKVVNKQFKEHTKVYCPFEPEYNRIVIDHGIDTYNCYLLKCEEDTREEWAAVTQRALSCLTTGGGIGIDYSVLRPAGRVLSRTGGLSSGPIPLMYIINEVGRNVMQGGSRRSAIYASLNWQHEDASDFLIVKNWDTQPITKDYSFWDAKMDNFNFPCPLDMTNISLNYDDAFLDKIGDYHEYNGNFDFVVNNNKSIPSTFLQNVEQALRTGEPGFSFNFGDKGNETLRNAPVSGDTRVLTSVGYQTVSSTLNDGVRVWTGKRWAWTHFKKTKENVETLKISLSNGRSIKCDPEHPFIVWTKSGTKRVEAQYLTPGTAIVSDLPVNPIYNYPSTPLYGWGFIFGDGSVKDGKGDCSYFVENKKECFEKAKSDLEGWGNLDNRFYCKMPFDSKEDIANSDITIRTEQFIAGWFDADGSYTRGMLRISNRDKNNLLRLSEALDYHGISSVVREDGKSSYKPDNKMYTLQVFKSSFKRFAEIIPTIRIKLDVPKKVRKQNILVSSVEKSGVIEDVYCCDVGYEEHSFMAEGVLISNCTEVTSEDDSDCCNLGSVNIGNIESIEEFREVVRLAAMFLVCGTVRAQLPYQKVYDIREKNRRLGLGLMGMHEWLLKRGYKYEVVPELHKWLKVYRDESERSANKHCDRFYLSKPVAYRAIAPTGTIGILAGTTTGIEPLFAVAYKRRYLVDGTKWKYEYVVDSTADLLIKEYGLDANSIETASDLAKEPERRIRFQADVQDYVDMSISSTINLPAWGSEYNNPDKVMGFATTLSKYAHRLRGSTFYPDGSRGGQPITTVDYNEAIKHKGVVYEENDSCKGGVCGI